MKRSGQRRDRGGPAKANVSSRGIAKDLGDTHAQGRGSAVIVAEVTRCGEELTRESHRTWEFSDSTTCNIKQNKTEGIDSKHRRVK